VEENIDIVGGMAVHIYNGDEELEYRQAIFLETPVAKM